MEIKLLKPEYKIDDNFHKAFLKGELEANGFVSNQSVYIDDAPDFPVYIGNGVDDKLEKFVEGCHTMANTYIKNDANIFEEELFWHSLLCIYKRDYLLENYPQIKSKKEFERIVLKKFFWENYIYKMIFAAKYVSLRTQNEDEQDKYFRSIYNNLDLFNYMIKYTIFRNADFILNVIDVVEESNLSGILKSRKKDTPDEEDYRYSRLVIYELNKSYPIIMSPMLNKDMLKKEIFKFLSYYYEGDDVDFKNMIVRTDDEKKNKFSII